MTTVEAPIAVERTRTGRPRVRLNQDAITYWTERVVQKRTDRWTFEDIDRNSIIMSGDTIFHYGRHFPVATIIRKPNGWARMVLFNGDRYSGASGWGSSTWQVQLTVQAAVRQQIEQSGKNIPTITIPFSALSAAGIDQTTVRPLHVLEDRTERTAFSSNERPGDLRKMADPSGATYAHTSEAHGYIDAEGNYVGTHGSPRAREEGVRWGAYTKVEERPVMVDDPNRCNVEVKTAGWCHEGATRAEDGTWHWTVETHKLGEALFTARYTSTHVRDATAEEIAAFEDMEKWQQEYRNAGYPNLDDLSSLGVRERPATPPENMTKRQLVMGGAAYTVRFTKSRVEKFLSSFDYAEPHAPYFMCELPHGCAARTISEALEALKPAQVKQAETLGLDIVRQGDIFGIRTTFTEAELVERAVTVERQFHRGLTQAPWSEVVRETVAIRKIGQDGYPPTAKDIHGSTHQATHLIVTKDGEMYGRGRLYHRPSGWGRRAEHVVVELGDRKTWYRLVKNTVPTGPSGQIRSAGGLQQSGNARAWMLGGQVD